MNGTLGGWVDGAGWKGEPELWPFKPVAGKGQRAESKFCENALPQKNDPEDQGTVGCNLPKRRVGPGEKWQAKPLPGNPSLETMCSPGA